MNDKPSKPIYIGDEPGKPVGSRLLVYTCLGAIIFWVIVIAIVLYFVL